MSQKITEGLIKKIEEDMIKAMNDVAKNHGVKLNFGNWNYSNVEARSKFTISVVGTAGVEKKYVDTYNMLARIKGLPELNSRVNVKGHYYTIIGYNSRRSKYPIMIRRADGKMQGATESWLLKAEIVS